MSKLAAFGGTPVVPQHLRRSPWPLVQDDDRKAVMNALDGARLVSDTDGDNPVSTLEQDWARHFGHQHCVAVSNGTTALSLALAALGIGPGDEVIVPALSFIATALAPIHQMAVPVFADIDPVTFNIDPADLQHRITDRTAAIIVVHLHGAPADMDPIMTIADRHGIPVLEDAAQAPGATHHGRPVGSIGAAGAFSLQVTKNIPTCGEGGLLVTADPDLAAAMRRGRQFGEVIQAGQERDYISHCLGWNHKMNALQAAFTSSQLTRFQAYEHARQQNVTAFLARLATLPGLQVPTALPDTTHVWHILRFRFDPAAFGLDTVPPPALRSTLRRLLRAEGVPVSQYQLMPLPDQKVFTDRLGFGSGHPWTLTNTPGTTPGHGYPATRAVIADSLTIQKRHLNPDAANLLNLYADAFEKVWAAGDLIATLAKAAS